MRSDTQVLTVLVLLGLAGAALYLATRTPQPQPLPLSPQALAYRRNGHASFAQAVPYYQNEEEWSIKRDAGGRIAGITVHRDARRSA